MVGDIAVPVQEGHALRISDDAVVAPSAREMAAGRVDTAVTVPVDRVIDIGQRDTPI